MKKELPKWFIFVSSVKMVWPKEWSISRKSSWMPRTSIARRRNSEYRLLPLETIGVSQNDDAFERSVFQVLELR